MKDEFPWDVWPLYWFAEGRRRRARLQRIAQTRYQYKTRVSDERYPLWVTILQTIVPLVISGAALWVAFDTAGSTKQSLTAQNRNQAFQTFIEKLNVVCDNFSNEVKRFSYLRDPVNDHKFVVSRRDASRPATAPDLDLIAFNPKLSELKDTLQLFLIWAPRDSQKAITASIAFTDTNKWAWTIDPFGGGVITNASYCPDMRNALVAAYSDNNLRAFALPQNYQIAVVDQIDYTKTLLAVGARKLLERNIKIGIKANE